MDKNSNPTPEPNDKQRTDEQSTPESEDNNRESKKQTVDSSTVQPPPSDPVAKKDPPPHQEGSSVGTTKTPARDSKMPSLTDAEPSSTKKPAVRPLSPPRTDNKNGGDPTHAQKTVVQPSNPTNRPSSPNQTVPNMTPGISNFLRQQNTFQPPHDAQPAIQQNRFQPSQDAQAAIQHLALQVREMSPMYSEESTAAAAPAPKHSKTTKIISEMKERGEAALISSKAQSAAAAIHNIAFGVKNTVGTQNHGSELSTSKEILLQRGQRSKLKKDMENGASAKKQQAIVDLSKGNEYDQGSKADAEVARMLEARKRRTAASAEQQQMYRSTRQPWEKSESDKRRSSSKQQQQHGQFHRSKAEEAAMIQNHLLQSIQTEQNNRARNNSNNNNAIGSGWTAREAALIAESNPDTVQKILAAQGRTPAPAPPPSLPQQQFMWQQQMERHAAEQRGSMGSSSNDTSRRGVAPTDLAHNEAAMTTLVRKLLGQLSVHGDEPPIVLGPQLIMSISDKIKLVISRLVDIQDERFTGRLGDKRMRSGDEAGGTDEEQQHNKRLKAYAQQQSELVHEQQMKINTLQRQLDERSAELTDQRNELSAMRGQYRVEDDSAIRNLLKQLDTGMQTASRQKKEITALRAVINQDAADIQQKDDVIEVLRAQTARDEEAIRQLKTQTGGEHSEVTSLRREVKELRDTLQSERRQCESTTRAYMRAAVHAIKVQKSNLKE